MDPPAGERRVVARRYELGRELGAGSFGRVWLARDLVGQRDVALKRIRGDYAGDAIVRRRLWREARAVSRLDHPAIVRLVDYGEDEGREPYVVMELVAGEPLNQAAEKAGSAGLLAGWLDQLLDALSYAHARGVVHRDLKPQNVLLTHREVAEGDPQAARRVKVLDFGFARVEEDPDMNITGSTGEAVGTPTYMSPEQAAAHNLVGPASDLYSVGIMAWEMFCGTLPFLGPNATATILMQVRAPLPPFQPRPELKAPPELGAVLARALEKDPRRRFPDAASMRRALWQAFDRSDDDFEETLVTGQPGGITAEPTGSGPSGTLQMDWLQMARLAARPEECPVLGREPWQRQLWLRVGEICQTERPQLVLLGGSPGVGRHRLGRWLVETAVRAGVLTPLDLSQAAGDVRAADPVGAALRVALGLGPAVPLDPVAAVTEALIGIGAERALEAEALAERFWAPPGSALPKRGFALHDLLAQLATRRPVLLWLGRWAEHSTLAAHGMAELVERAFERGLPVLVVALVDETPLFALGPVITRFPALVERLHIDPLSPSTTSTLLARHLPETPNGQPLLSALQSAAGGNPLLACQLVHLLLESGAIEGSSAGPRWRGHAPAPPVGLRAAVSARLAAIEARDPDMLGEDLNRLAAGLAVLGLTFSVGLAERLAAREGHSARAAALLIERLVDASLLVEHGRDGLSFVHPIVRSTLLEALEPAIRQRLHRACAELLLGAAGVDLTVAARHLAGSGQRARARELLANAAEQALRLADADTAERLLGEVSEAPTEPDPERVHLARREALLRVQIALERGRGEEALRLLEAHGAGASEAERHARVRLQAEALLLMGDAVAAEPLLAGQLGRAEGHREGPPAARVRWLLGRCLLARGRLREARPLLIAARGELAAQGEVVAEGRCRLDLSALAEAAGDAAAGLRFAQDAAALGGDAAEGTGTAEAALRAADLLRRTGQLAEAREAFTAAWRRFSSRGHLQGQARASKGLAQVTRLLGDHAESRLAYERARTAYAAAGDAHQAGQCEMHLGWIHVRAGELDRAEGCFLRALTALQGSEDALRLGLLYGFLARVAHYRGDREQRQRRLAEALRLDAARCLALPEWPRILEELAEAMVREGDPDQASALLNRAAEVWRLLRQPDDEARCHRLLREL